MEELNLEVDEKSTGERLDRYLVRALENRFSRSFIARLIDGKNVLVDGRQRKAHYRVMPGESITLSIPEPESIKLKPENIPLDIVYEDKDLIVINKPAGISVHPAGHNVCGTLVNALLYHCGDLAGIGGALRPGIVHRLDKETSGLLVAAKNDATHRNLSGQFKNRTVKRKYVALVRGIVQLDNGRIELPIARRPKDITRMGVSFADKRKKNAVTNYSVIKRFKDFTMLELSLETGRTHQIRVHLSHIGHPVIGDKMYGSQKGLDRNALHAVTLGFFHPTTKKFMEFTSELPGEIQDLIKRGKL
ncbi:MAG: RluA family pseudouridine synthase [Candidatus Omnitrophica bacterium]|nr:RluA family pseudouridine synthase [Candidatus Omnitrophota bacterium]